MGDISANVGFKWSGRKELKTTCTSVRRTRYNTSKNKATTSWRCGNASGAQSIKRDPELSRLIAGTSFCVIFALLKLMKINAMMYASGGKKDCGITVKQKIYNDKFSM
jgi:hypothetical protein